MISLIRCFLIRMSESYRTVKNTTNGITKFWQKCQNFWDLFETIYKYHQIFRIQEMDLTRLYVHAEVIQNQKISSVYLPYYLTTKLHKKKNIWKLLVWLLYNPLIHKYIHTLKKCLLCCLPLLPSIYLNILNSKINFSRKQKSFFF